MREGDRTNTSKYHIRVFLGGQSGHLAVEFHYDSSRCGEIPLQVLDEHRGLIRTDGYNGHNQLGVQAVVVHAWCCAHVRSKFYGAKAASKQSTSADEALARINVLFTIERNLRAEEISDAKFLLKRRTHVQPVLEKLGPWLHSRKEQLLPSGLLG